MNFFSLLRSSVKCSHVLHSNFTRFTSSLTSTSKKTYGYESSVLGDFNLDSSWLEKSIRRGCRTFIVNSSSKHRMKTFELLSDLSVADELILSECLIGYRLQEQKIINVDDTAKEIMAIRDVLNSPLNFVTIPLTIKKDKSIADCTASVLHDLDLLNKIINNNNHNHHHHHHETSTICGLDFNSELLEHAQEQDVAAILHCLSNTAFSAALPPQLVLTVATNSATFRNSKRIFEWAASLQHSQEKDDHSTKTTKTTKAKMAMTTIATELLRTHSRRPGLISPPLLSSKAAKLIRGKEGVSAGLKEAATKLSEAMERCLHAEKQFMEKLSAQTASSSSSSTKGGVGGFPPLTEICWAHVLMEKIPSIQSSEEWAYILTNQVSNLI